MTHPTWEEREAQRAAAINAKHPGEPCRGWARMAVEGKGCVPRIEPDAYDGPLILISCDADFAEEPVLFCPWCGLGLTP